MMGFTNAGPVANFPASFGGSHVNSGGASATAGFRINTDGTFQVTQTVGGAYGSNTQWQFGGTNADFEARMTFVSGTALTTGTVGSFVALTAQQTWTLAVGTAASAAASYTLDIRRVSTGTIVDTATVSFNADTT